MPGSGSVAYTALTLAVLVSACASQPTSSGDDRMSVSIAVGAIRVQSAQNAYVDVTIPLLVTNSSGEAVFMNPCAPVLERSSADRGWQMVFAQMCSLGTTEQDIEIPAGTERTVEFAVRTPLGSGAGYRWNPPLDGEYRLRTSIRTGREMLPESVGVTSSFRLPAP